MGLPIIGAKRVLFSVATKTKDKIGLLEIQDIAKRTTEAVNKDGHIIFGTVEDPTLKENQVRITVIATEIDESNREFKNPHLSVSKPQPKVPKKGKANEPSESLQKQRGSIPRVAGLPKIENI